jgi:hypothetical protein
MTSTTWWTHAPGDPGSAARFPPPPAPDPPPPSPSLAPRVGVGPTRWTLALLVLGGLAFDGFARSGYGSLGCALFVVAVAVVLLASGRARNPQVVGLVLAAVTLAAFVAVRASVWLVPLDTILAFGLLAVAASYARGGSVVEVTGSSLAIRAVRCVVTFLTAPAYLLAALAAALPAPDARRRDRYVAIGRGVGLALPVLVVLGLLLASADAVFGSLFHIPIDPVAATQHLVLIVVGMAVVSVVLVDASNPVLPVAPSTHRPLGMTEASIVLGGLVALYGTFAVVQVVVAARGEGYVQQTAGVTYAEHARQGFFQLLAVAALTLGVLVCLRAVTTRTTRAERIRFVVLAELAVLLTLVIVGVAIVRLGLYEQALGLTMLRYASTWVAWWLGAVFVITGIALAGVRARQPWLTFALACSFVIALVAFNLADPEAIVVQHNVAREQAVGRLDTQYLAELSDDAVPELAASLPLLPAAQQEQVRSFICTGAPPHVRSRRPTGGEPADHGGLSRNVAAVRADVVRARLCRTS